MRSPHDATAVTPAGMHGHDIGVALDEPDVPWRCRVWQVDANITDDFLYSNVSGVIDVPAPSRRRRFGYQAPNPTTSPAEVRPDEPQQPDGEAVHPSPCRPGQSRGLQFLELKTACR